MRAEWLALGLLILFLLFVIGVAVYSHLAG
jgi:hypothetical protein